MRIAGILWIVAGVSSIMPARACGQIDPPTRQSPQHTGMRMPPPLVNGNRTSGLSIAKLQLTVATPTTGECDTLAPPEVFIDLETGDQVKGLRLGWAWLISADTGIQRLISVVRDSSGALVSYHDIDTRAGYDLHIHPKGGPTVVLTPAGLVSGSADQLLHLHQLGPAIDIARFLEQSCPAFRSK